MPNRRIFGNVPGLKPMTLAPAFGEPVYEIVIQTNDKGMMKTSITKYPPGNPPSQLQMLGMLLDCMQGQFQGMVQSASMLIDPNGKSVSNGGQEKENHNGGGGDTGGGTSGS